MNFTKESVYILGLLWADGHIREEKKLTTINCSETDINDIKYVFEKTGHWLLSGTIKKHLVIKLGSNSIQGFVSPKKSLGQSAYVSLSYKF